MKKIITFAAVAAFTMMASATSLKWGYGSAYLYVSEDGVTGVQGGTIPSGAQVCLIYLGSETTYDIANVTDAMVIDSYAAEAEFDGTDYYMAGGTQTYQVTEGKTVEAKDGTSITMGSNDNFGIVFYDGTSYSCIYDVVDYDTGKLGAELKQVANIGAITPTAPMVSLDGTAGATQDDWEIPMAAVKVSSTPIPEPATAALALLGLGMMFRRRRA